MKFYILQFIFLWGILLGSNAQTHTYYVSESGNDSNNGSFESPFKTIQNAAKIMIPGDTCMIRAGIFRETVVPSMSGTAGNPIVFIPYACEKVVISGADVLTNPWSVYKENIYKTYMPWTMGLGKDQVFVDSGLKVQARHPNQRSGAMAMPPVDVPLSPLWPHAFGKFEVTAGSDIITNPTDLNQDQKDYWKGALYLGFHKWSWCMQSATITASSKGQLTFANRTKAWWFPDDADLADYKSVYDSIQNGYLTNHLHALDKEGEWHWQNDTLYLWPGNNSNPTSSIVEAKKRQLAFDLKGRDYIVLKNLNIISASVTMYNANNCIIDGCRLSYISHFQQWVNSRDGMIDGENPGSTSALFRGEAGVIVGGTDNTIRNSIIEYSSGAGLYLNGKNTTVSNCIIHDCGYTSTYLGCIYIYNDLLEPNKQVGGHRINHCELYNAGRSIILIQGSNTQTIFDAIEISNNRIHDGNIIGNDGGLIYSYHVDLGTAEMKTQIHHNLIWNQWGQFWSGLVYPDNYSFKMETHHNILWYSEKNRYAPQGLFWKWNPPIDCIYRDNTEKRNYSGGIAGLKRKDYKGNFFETGASFCVNSNECGLISEGIVPAKNKR